MACCCGRVFPSIPAAGQTGRSGPSCRGCHLGSGRCAASARGRCRTAWPSAPGSPPASAAEAAAAPSASAPGRWKGKASGGVVGATPGVPFEARWAGVCRGPAGAMAKRRSSAGPGRRLAAVGGVAVGLGSGRLLVSLVEE